MDKIMDAYLNTLNLASGEMNDLIAGVCDESDLTREEVQLAFGEEGWSRDTPGKEIYSKQTPKGRIQVELATVNGVSYTIIALELVS